MKLRKTLNVFCLAAGICILYRVLSMSSTCTVLSSSRQAGDNGASDLHVNVKSRLPDDNGKLELTLSMNTEDIVMKYTEGHQRASGEATSNPVARNTTFIKNPANTCKDSPNLKYIAYIHTSPGNVIRRGNVRRTWGNRELFRDGRLKVVFMVGIAPNAEHEEVLDKEHDQYKDIVQGDFLDDYHNLTLKGIMALKWVSEFCPTATFAIKADDDAFIDIFNLIDLIEYQKDPNRLILCSRINKDSMPILRDPANRWYVKSSEFPGQKNYPQYCSGITYVLSNDIVPEMLQKSYSTPFFWIDDVYITGLLTAKIQRLNYVNIWKNIHLKGETLAAQDFRTDNKSQYMVAHVASKENFNYMWNLCLHRISDQQLQMLSSHVISEHPQLKERWEKLRYI